MTVVLFVFEPSVSVRIFAREPMVAGHNLLAKAQRKPEDAKKTNQDTANHA